jgi:hypothetical protein
MREGTGKLLEGIDLRQGGAEERLAVLDHKLDAVPLLDAKPSSDFDRNSHLAFAADGAGSGHLYLRL